MAWSQVMADDALAVGFEDRLLLGVVFAGEAVVVPFGAVGLDHEALLWPSEVGDHVRPSTFIGTLTCGGVEPRIEEEVEDRVLEFAAGWGVAGGQDPGEVGDAGAGAEAVEGVRGSAGW